MSAKVQASGKLNPITQSFSNF